MMYKITIEMPKFENGNRFLVEVIFKEFEEVINKIMKDLDSLWKGIMLFPYEFTIVEVENTDIRMRLIEDDGKEQKIIAEQTFIYEDILDFAYSKIQEHYKKTGKFLAINDDLDRWKGVFKLIEQFGSDGDKNLKLIEDKENELGLDLEDIKKVMKDREEIKKEIIKNKLEKVLKDGL